MAERLAVDLAENFPGRITFDEQRMVQMRPDALHYPGYTCGLRRLRMISPQEQHGPIRRRIRKHPLILFPEVSFELHVIFKEEQDITIAPQELSQYKAFAQVDGIPGVSNFPTPHT